MRGCAHRPLGMEAAAGVVIPAILLAPSWRSAGVGTAMIIAGAQFGDIADWDQHVGKVPFFGPLLSKLLPHRGPTHSITAALLVSWLMAHAISLPWMVAGLSFSGWPDQANMVFWAVFASMMTHPIADLVNTTGIAIFYPFPELVELLGKILMELGNALRSFSKLLGGLVRDTGGLLRRLGKFLERIGPTPFGIHQSSGAGGMQAVNPAEKAIEFLAWGVIGPIALVLAIAPALFHVVPGLQVVLAAMGR